MGKLDEAVQGQLAAGERVRHTLEGSTSGLNRSLRQPNKGVIAVTSAAVVVAWTKPGLISSAEAHRFLAREILSAIEGEDDLPGIAGALAKKNASHPLMKVMGSKSAKPTLLLSTRQGDFQLYLTGKERSQLRQVRLAIEDLASAR